MKAKSAVLAAVTGVVLGFLAGEPSASAMPPNADSCYTCQYNNCYGVYRGAFSCHWSCLNCLVPRCAILDGGCTTYWSL